VERRQARVAGDAHLPPYQRVPGGLACQGICPSVALAEPRPRHGDDGDRCPSSSVHVRDTSGPPALLGGPGRDPPDAEAKAWEVVAEARRALGSHVGSVATRVQEGRPGLVIVGIARACHADLVAIGSGRSSAGTRFLAERVSVHVVRHAHCSVLMAKSLPAEPQRFLLVLDDSADEGTAIRWLADLRLSPEALIHVVAVVGGRRDSWVRRSLDRRGHIKGTRVGRLTECAAAESSVTEASHRLAASGARVTAAIRRGQTAGEILAAARAFAPHLLVVGAREERAAPDTVLSSLAERVIARAPCSVLVVRS
jgi:nucleotide-binding universal stress UspA family protein